MTTAIGRVLLALDAAADARAAIDIAARLAVRAGVRLHAVFVEDEELLNLDWRRASMVEPRGIEPLTFALRTRRSPS